MDIFEKLQILAESAKFDVSCSSSGGTRRGRTEPAVTISEGTASKNTKGSYINQKADITKGRGIRQTIGDCYKSGICHSFCADGRCISLLKVLFTNKCVYDCKYCVNRRSADTPRASFEPEELAKLTIDFYKRNYIEGLFLSSGVEKSPDYTAERILKCLQLLRHEYQFFGYIHAKIIPGVDQKLIEEIGLLADRLSVNIEMPTRESLALYAPQKKPLDIMSPMKQITNTLIEQKSLKGPGYMFKGVSINSPANYLGAATALEPAHELTGHQYTSIIPRQRAEKKAKFAPAGQTTQMIVGAGKENDLEIISLSEKLYHTFKMKRVYFSAYIPVVKDAMLPSLDTKPPLRRENRLYQADWLLRFYGFQAKELLLESNPYFDEELDPKTFWALNNISYFPMEINRASFEELLRVPGIGVISAKRIIRQRKIACVRYEDLKLMGVVLKRAKYFITCQGKYYGKEKSHAFTMDPEFLTAKIKMQNLSPLPTDTIAKEEALRIRAKLTGQDQGVQLSFV